MDFPPLGISFYSTALTRTVQSIVSPCLYNGSHIEPSSSGLSYLLSLERAKVKIEGDETKPFKIEKKEVLSTELNDRYAETIETVARNVDEDVDVKVEVEVDVDVKPILKKPIKKWMPSMNKTIKKERKKERKRRLCADPILLEAPLIVNEELNTHQSNGRNQMWWFILEILMDPANRHIIAWTGQYYSFRIIDKELFTKMWCGHNDRSRIIAWSSVCRAMRLCYGDKGILTPVSQRDRIWAFVVDISIPLEMSREAIQEYIDKYKNIPPIPIKFDKSTACLRVHTMDESAKMQVPPPLPPITFGSPLCEFNSTCLPSSPTLTSLELGIPSLTSSFFPNETISSNTHSSPYWLPVPISPMFTSYFLF